MPLPNLASFYVPWVFALAAAQIEPPAIGAPWELPLGDVRLPLIQTVLAIAGVLLSRPLAPRRSGERGWLRQAAVTLIMVIVAVAWVSESRPGVLFTFVVSIGLGFSGYALIENAGEQIEGLVKRLGASMAAAIESFGGKPK